MIMVMYAYVVAPCTSQNPVCMHVGYVQFYHIFCIYSHQVLHSLIISLSPIPKLIVKMAFMHHCLLPFEFISLPSLHIPKHMFQSLHFTNFPLSMLQCVYDDKLKVEGVCECENEPPLWCLLSPYLCIGSPRILCFVPLVRTTP